MSEINISTTHPSKWRLIFPFMDFLSENEKGDDLTLYCSEVTLPGLTLNSNIIETPYLDLKEPTNKLSTDDLIVTFSVDELFVNYKFLLDWLYYIKDVSRFEVRNQKINASLWSYSNNDNPKTQFVLENIWPMAIEALSFSNKIDDADDLECTVTFVVENFKIQD